MNLTRWVCHLLSLVRMHSQTVNIATLAKGTGKRTCAGGLKNCAEPHPDSGAHR
jgi:hypothetical protein